MNDAAAGRVLVVDDEPDLLTLYELTLLREGHSVETASTVAEALEALTQSTFRLVITDMRLPDGSGMDLLRWLDKQRRNEKAIVVTAFGSAENAVEALKVGAFDYLTKPVDLRQFRTVVASAMGRVAPTAAGAAPSRGGPLHRLAGRSSGMQQVRELVEKVARSMAPVLVHGESGTGKELVARGIHEVSARAAGPFVAVNCGAIPEALLEAEFFGYRKGAFTGATEDREGFFQAAAGGTLFLDEIGDLPLAMQSKLLRVIQERAVRPVGATAEQPTNVRLVSATHKDLAQEVAQGRFRQDLFYRLNVIRIPVPPLRERMEDLVLICDVLLERIANEAGVSPPPVLALAARERLASYAFPGNVRELENLLHRAVALSAGDEITPQDLGLPEQLVGRSLLDDEAEASLPPGAAAAAATHDESLPSDLARHLDEVERRILERALHQHGFNRTAAGARLGLSLRQMRYRMARLGISEGASGDEAGER
ncbi:sigma-54-dependent Fis family transcriptional regulator [Ideonella sp. 4Y16]|uniref:Sigma-54-dependent Fis family transcriptional regulator n=1 Tax=Ideonella alba TaxID=2824118 RepID=A0A941BND1_9BURK|nr:sigma-54 dependent transcriptional regulator [Ideonella alba]MBQ0933199.1 sigma-54-dependent Fis family transcriptional regulator [Ideonella alba]MBQ0944670.1 sigma-54-dependent Fis family transcriptional regulator [Ideonella alba]